MSTNFSKIPQLPEIDDFDLLFQVYTHKELRPSTPGEPCEWGDEDRLAELGAHVLGNVVTVHLFAKRPLIRAEEIRTWREHHTSENILAVWLDNYQLKDKLRTPPNRRDAILNDQQEMASFFHRYVGALFITKGLPPIQAWISKLIDPDANIDLITQHQQRGSQSAAGPPVDSDTTSRLPPIPPAVANIPVSLVNQTAAQRGVTINYTVTSVGPSHAPTWTVRCEINNVEKGVGEGKTQKGAKDDAARRAWVAMGW